MRNLVAQKNPQNVWDVLDQLPRGIGTWEDILEVVAELRRVRNWRSVIVVCNLHLPTLSFYLFMQFVLSELIQFLTKKYMNPTLLSQLKSV